MLLGPGGRSTVRLRASTPGQYALIGYRAPAIALITHKATLFTQSTPSSPSRDVSAHSHVQSTISNIQRRHIQQSSRRTTTLTPAPHPDFDPYSPSPPEPTDPITRAPLSVLPLHMIIRSLFTTTISSSPLLLPPSLHVMKILAHASSPLLNPDKNPLLRMILKKSFYKQFCAGENGPEVRETVGGLKNIGFTGVIICYAKEVVLTAEQQKAMGADMGEETEDIRRQEIAPWRDGTLETVRLAEPGDFVALKFTGAGRLALHQLKHRLSPSPTLAASIDSICSLARERGVRLLFDAEQDALQDGIDDWTLCYSKKYNADSDLPTIYGTYQAYKKAAPAILSSHLNVAKMEGFSLGVKLVRGAYLGSDPREVFHDTKEQTDDCFNSMAASVLTRQWGTTVMGNGEYPNAHLVLATHNPESVRRARAIVDAGAAKSDIAFAQLLGMADEVSCELVEASLSRQQAAASSGADQGAMSKASTLPVFKYLVWGSTGECMKYLHRRAQENKDAVQRTRDGRDAMFIELIRRCKRAVGFA